MRLIVNLLAFLGLITIILVAVALTQLPVNLSSISKFDANAGKVYMGMMQGIMDTGNAAEATIWKVPVEEGLTPEDVEEAMKSVANEHNIKNVGELPLYKQVASMSGKDYRFVKIYMFCDALTASRMLDFSDAYSAYLPCRVSLVEDKTGKLWIYTLNMDMMIHGGHELPPALKKEAIQVKTILTDIMNRGAAGEF